MIEDSYSSERASYFSAVPSFGQDKANRENANAGHRRAEGKCKLAEQSREQRRCGGSASGQGSGPRQGSRSAGSLH